MATDDPPDADGIPRELDRATGEKGDLGVWEDDPGLHPAPVWDGKRAIFSYLTHSHMGEHFEVGDDLVVVFRDRAVVCEVTDVDAEDDE